MESKFKIIIMDVDGTLTNSQKIVTPKTKAALMKAQELGIKLILACVRPMIDKGEYMFVNNVYDNYINFNGAPFNVIEYESRGGNYKLCEIDDLAAFADFEINKILTTSDPEYLQEHYQEMMEPFKDSLSCMFTGPFYFEFTAQGIDKAKALDTVLKPMGYSQDEMIAFGDGHNDASMVKYAGTGVAMANAVQDLKDISQYITLSNDEDGIAEALYKYIPELKD